MTRDNRGRFMKGNVQIPKGTHVSANTEFKKGHEISIEIRKKISKANYGKTAWNKNLKGEEYTKHFLKGVKGGRKKGFKVTEKTMQKLKRSHYSKKEGYINPMKDKKRPEHSLLMSGKNNPSWLGGKSFEPYNKLFNNKFKRAIRKRDNQVCMLCGIHREKLNQALTVHHVDYNKLLSIPQNCISLCRKCHGLTIINRKHHTKFFQDLLNKVYDYQYSETKEIILEVNNG